MKKKSPLIKMFLITFIFFGSVTIFCVGVVLPKIRANDIIKEKAVIVEAKRVQDKFIEDKRIADKIVEDKKIADKIIEAKRISDEKIATKIREDKIREDQRMKDQQIANEKAKQSSTMTIKYTMTDGYFSDCNYTNGSTLQFKVGQVLKLKGNLINSTERVMSMGAGGDEVMSWGTNSITMIAVGGGEITIIPNKYEWDRAYTFHIVVSN